MIHRIIYRSKATEELTDSELRSLAMFARIRNKAANISGLLLHHNTQVMQVLEGEPEAVKALYAKIEKDSRHKDISLLVNETSEDRIFEDWSMGYRPLDTSAEMDKFFTLTREALKDMMPNDTTDSLKENIRKFSEDSNL